MSKNGFIVINKKEEKTNWGIINTEAFLVCPEDNMFLGINENTKLDEVMNRIYVFIEKKDAEKFCEGKTDSNMWNLKVRENNFNLKKCPECNGEGIIPIVECETCGHKGYVYIES